MAKNIFEETQDQRDIELATYFKVPIAEVRKYAIGSKSSIQLYKDEDIKSQSYNFIYADYKYVEKINWLRTCAAFTVTRRADYVVKLTKKMAPVAGKKILDFGCGVGSHGIFCAEMGAQVDFLDVKGPLYDYALWRISRRKLTIGSVLYPENVLPTAYYDAIICLDVLEHVANPVASLVCLAEALKPNGYLSLEVSMGIQPTSGHFSQSINLWKTQGLPMLDSLFNHLQGYLFIKK
jgi:SAM-dependent methyltransferase